MTTLNADPSLGTTGIDGAIRSMIGVINNNPFFAPLVDLFKNATQTDSKDIWVTTENPNGAVKDEAMYNWRYTTTSASGGYSPSFDWSNATSTGTGTAAAGQGIGVVRVDTTKWAEKDLDPGAGVDKQWVRGWPGENAYQDASVGRMIVHELAHGITDPSVTAFRDTVAGHEFNYNEEIASFIENVYYVGYAKSVGLHDTFLAKGHEAPLGGYPHDMGAFGVAYFDEGSIPAISVDRSNGQVTFTDYNIAEGGSIAKSYHSSNTTINGNHYSRYITIEYLNYGGVMSVDETGTVNLERRVVDKIIPESVAHDPQQDLQNVADMRSFVGDIAEKVGESTFSDISFLGTDSNYIHVDQMRFLTIGADRYFSNQTGGAIDVAGPTEKGTNHNPAEIAIDDRTSGYWYEYGNQHWDFDQYTSTVIMGASGIGTAGDVLDTTQSHDWIKSGLGDDILIGGRNSSTVGNTLDGGTGNDIMIEGTAYDHLFGGIGLDVFVLSAATGHGGSPGTTVNGGTGFDIASYLESGAVNYDKATGKAAHDGRQDTLVGIEMVVGSEKADTLKGDHMVLAGGKGNDIIHLGNGTTAIGGEGDDEFHIAITGSGTFDYYLQGVDAGDKLFLNGSIHLGSNRTEQHGVGPNGTDTYVSFTSGNGANPYATSYYESAGRGNDYWTESLFYGDQGQAGSGQDMDALLQIRHYSGGSLASTTNIWMSDYHPGDAGLAFNAYSYMNQTPQNDPFHYGVLESMF